MTPLFKIKNAPRHDDNRGRSGQHTYIRKASIYADITYQPQLTVIAFQESFQPFKSVVSNHFKLQQSILRILHVVINFTLFRERNIYLFLR